MAQSYGGRWKNLGDLGSGGQGKVFRVVDTRGEHKGEFALKRVQNPNRNWRFQKEVEAIKLLQHPNIITLIDHSAFDDASAEKQYLVMPIAAGGDLGQEGRVRLYTDNIDAVLGVAKQVASGLSAAHAAGVTHRDIKPANILSTGNGHDVWISDFGICFLRDSERHTEMAEVVGPRSFMAPELEYGGKLEVMPGADIYSLGKVIFFLVTGGVVLPCEYLHEEQFSKYLEKSQQHRFLRNLLHRMICPVQDRLNDMNLVIDRLDYISAWQQNASLTPLNSATLSTIERLRQKQLTAEREAGDDAAAREYERQARVTVTDTFMSWLQDELAKTVKHLVDAEGLACSCRPAERLTLKNLQIGVSDQIFYECISGMELQVPAVSKGRTFTHRLQLYLCDQLDMVQAFGYRGHGPPTPPARDPPFAFVPVYRKTSPNQPPKSAVEAGFLNRRKFHGTVRGQLNISGDGLIQPAYGRVMLLSNTFSVDASQHVTFRASEWPGNVESINAAIAEAMESFFEIVETNASTTPPIPQ
jgi:serine/threonine protein kinase